MKDLQQRLDEPDDGFGLTYYTPQAANHKTLREGIAFDVALLLAQPIDCKAECSFEDIVSHLIQRLEDVAQFMRENKDVLRG